MLSKDDGEFFLFPAAEAAAAANRVAARRVPPPSTSACSGSTTARATRCWDPHQYEMDVFNGDEGFIQSMMDLIEHTQTVNFDGWLIPYDLSEDDELTLA